MENLLWSIPTIQSLGVNGSPLRGDLPIPMVATSDIGAKAAAFLADPEFQGHTPLSSLVRGWSRCRK
jgi:hypothetical protein